MVRYRLYKIIDDNWFKTSYVGNEKLMNRLRNSLSRSNICQFELKREYWRNGVFLWEID